MKKSMPKYIEKIRDNLKKYFTNKDMDIGNKIAYAIGYLEDNERVSKKETLKIIYEILMEKI